MTSQKICSIDECGKASLTRGWCRAHYDRWRGHGDPVAGKTAHGAPMTFLLESLSIEQEDCIIWPFGKSTDGYGKVWFDGKTQVAHRVVCAKAHGPAPSPKHEAAHSCGNGHLGCINWKHLAWKTPKENSADRVLHGTDSRGTRHGMSKLTEEDVREIRRLRGAMTQREIGEMFGVTLSTISDIQNGRSWGWLAQERGLI